jgi:uncharacterized membrane protein
LYDRYNLIDRKEQPSMVWALAIAAALWTLLAVAAPLSHEAWVYLLFRPVCHQHIERCFRIGGAPLAVCARCLGIYLGATAMLLLSAAAATFGLGRDNSASLRRLREAWRPEGRRCLVTALALVAADVVSERLGLRGPSAAVRLVTGLLAGSAAAAVLVQYMRMPAQAPYGQSRELAATTCHRAGRKSRAASRWQEYSHG